MGIRSGIADFSSNVAPAGPPKRALAALRGCLGKISEYPDEHSAGLVSALARHAGVDESCIIAGGGAAEIIHNFCRFVIPGRRVLIPVPTFSEYESASRLAGCRASFFKTMDLAGDLEEFLPRIPRGGCVFVCNPNNPTGLMLSKKDMAQIVAAAARKSCMVFADECFIELSQSPGESVIHMAGRRGNLLVLRSLTKSFALAGLRVGYAAASRGVVRTLEDSRVPWSVSVPAQEAGIAAVGDARHLKKCRKIIRAETEFLWNGISRIPGLECRRTSANFVLVRTRRDSGQMQRRLLQKGVLVRDCSNFRGLGRRHIRVAVRTRAQNAALLRALEAAA